MEKPFSQRMGRWIYNHQYAINGVIVLISILIGTLTGVRSAEDHVANGLIVGLLVMIICQMVLISTTVIKSSTNIDTVNKNIDILIGKNEIKIFIENREKESTISSLIRGAKKSIFISGITLRTIPGLADLLLNKLDHVKVELVAANPNCNELNHQYELIRGYNVEGIESELRGILEDKRNNSGNLTIKKVNFVTPALFVAIDIEQDEGCIKVEHLLNYTKDITQRPNFMVTKNNDWYSIYKEQIDIIRNNCIDYFDSQQQTERTIQETCNQCPGR